MKLCHFEAGLDQRLFLIAGPCTAESLELCIEVAGRLQEICAGQHAMPAATVRDTILDAVMKHQAGELAADDMTVLVIRRLPA